MNQDSYKVCSVDERKNMIRRSEILLNTKENPLATLAPKTQNINYGISNDPQLKLT